MVGSSGMASSRWARTGRKGIWWLEGKVYKQTLRETPRWPVLRFSRQGSLGIVVLTDIVDAW